MTLLALALAAPAAAQVADYEVTFEAFWNQTDHPTGFPASPHFSPIIGASHGAGDSYWEPGSPASSAIEAVAEEGNRAQLEAIIDASPHVLDKIVHPSNPPTPGVVPPLPFSVDADHPFVSIVTMVAPSPDWFVGVHGLDLRDGGGFVETLVVDLFAYDAGTEEGTAFSGSNPPSPPGGVITLVDQAAIFGGTSPVARLTFVRTGLAVGTVVEIQVDASDGDAEERPGGSVVLGSSDLELTEDGSEVQLVGLRFAGVPVPRDATVNAAWIQFQADEASALPTALDIRGHDSGDAPAFQAQSSDLSNRPLTSAEVEWIPDAWPVVGARGLVQRTPDLGAIVEELVDHPSWASGNGMAFVIEGTGRRTAEAYDGVPSAAATLHVDYTPRPSPPPTCGLGPELALVLAGLGAVRRTRWGRRAV
ncbi:MAG: spondin domain-containing protein [Myxococcota bacterium]|nr:spondin domain-containing protein [Myxococcota bacterium]